MATFLSSDMPGDEMVCCSPRVRVSCLYLDWLRLIMRDIPFTLFLLHASFIWHTTIVLLAFLLCSLAFNICIANITYPFDSSCCAHGWEVFECLA